MDKYFIGLDKMTLDELEVWRILCRHSNYETDIAGYTVKQILLASDDRLLLTPQKVRTILKKFENEGFVEFLTAGSKGKESTLKLTIKQQLFNNNATNKSECLQEVQEFDNNNLTTIQQLTNNTTKKKKKNKETNIVFSDAFTQIFNLWNSKKITVHKAMTDKMVKAYKKANKEYTHDEIVKAINDYSEILESEFYYSNRFTLENFLKQGNGLPNFTNEGQIYINYLQNKKTPFGEGASRNKKTNYNSSICNNGKSIPKVQEIDLFN